MEVMKEWILKMKMKVDGSRAIVIKGAEEDSLVGSPRIHNLLTPITVKKYDSI